MGRFQPKTNSAPQPAPELSWGEKDYLEMEKQVEEAKKLREIWMIEAPKKHNELRSIENYWLYCQKIVVVKPYYPSKDDPMTDIFYMAVRPDNYNFYTRKWQWYIKEHERRHYAENKRTQELDRMAQQEAGSSRDALSSKMRIQNHE